MTDTPGGPTVLPRTSLGGSIPLLLADTLTPSIPSFATPAPRNNAMALGIPASTLGLIVSGDVDGITIYTDRYGRKVAYPKAPPKEPPTAFQTYYRGRFKTAQANYMALTVTQKAEYEDLTKRANLCMTGQNLFIHVALKHTFGLLNTLQQQTAVIVIPPDPI